MTRSTIPLEPAHVDVLPALAACDGWLRGPGEALATRAAWVAEVDADWGRCGFVVRLGDRPVAHVVYAPPSYLPGLSRLPTTPTSPDALVLTDLWVDPDHRGAGLARHLVRTVARDLVDRYGSRVPAVETFAAVGPQGARAGEPCLRPRGLCEALGFIERRAHPSVPRMRLEPKAAVDWRGGVEHAWERLRAGVRPVPSRPAVRTSPGTTKPREADLPGLV